MAAELEQWRDNSSTEDTLTCLMDSAILGEEEEATTEFPLLIKKTRIFGNNPQILHWWYEVM